MLMDWFRTITGFDQVSIGQLASLMKLEADLVMSMQLFLGTRITRKSTGRIQNILVAKNSDFEQISDGKGIGSARI